MSGISQKVQKKFCYFCHPDNNFSLDVHGGGRGVQSAWEQGRRNRWFESIQVAASLKNRPRVILNKWPSTG